MHGGFREGSGRKQGFAAKTAEEARRIFAAKLAEEIEPIADVLTTKAKNGDVRAIKELFDRAWGRPPIALQHSLEALTISQVLDDLQDEGALQKDWGKEEKLEKIQSSVIGS